MLLKNASHLNLALCSVRRMVKRENSWARIKVTWMPGLAFPFSLYFIIGQNPSVALAATHRILYGEREELGKVKRADVKCNLLPCPRLFVSRNTHKVQRYYSKELENCPPRASGAVWLFDCLLKLFIFHLYSRTISVQSGLWQIKNNNIKFHPIKISTITRAFAMDYRLLLQEPLWGHSSDDVQRFLP